MAQEILLVDDSDIVRKVMRRIVEPMGFDVKEANNGLVAVDHCKNNMPEVILLDFNMPEMDGMEALKAIRALPNGSDPVIIFCTTVNEMDFIANAISSGANEYVMKPFDAEIIRGKFEQLGVLT